MPDTETERRCQACGALHVVFESHPSSGGMARASDPTAFPCQSCQQVLFERNVKDGASVLVLRLEDPLVGRLRSDRRSLGRRLAPLRLWWEDRDRMELAGWAVGVALVALAAWLLLLG